MKFKVGERVKVKTPYWNTQLRSRTGIVRHVTSYVIGVEFKNWTDGHNLGKTLTNTSGWYFPPTSLSRVKKRKPVSKKKVRRAR